MSSLSGLKGRVLFVLLAAVWILPGTVVRSPWKADEAYTFGLVHHIVESGDWVIPELGGEPFMQKPPVIFVTAALCGKMFGGLLGRETAYRLAVVIFQVLTLTFVGIGARAVAGPGKGWYGPVLFMGCLGFVQLSHMLICDVSLVTGFAIAFAGLALAGAQSIAPHSATQGSNQKIHDSLWKSTIVPGLLLGTGSGIAFMSKGLIGPGLIGVTAMLLVFCGPAWRTRRYAAVLAVAAVASLPWVLIWPMAVYQRSPELFKQWFLDNNLARFVGYAAVGRPNNLGLAGDRYNFFFAFPWFSWPAFPFICLCVWKERRALWRQTGAQICIVGLLVMLVVLSISRNSRTLYGLPMLVPACLLGARGVSVLTPVWAARLRVTAAIVAVIAVIVAWAFWLVQLFGWLPSGLWQRIHDQVPNYEPVFQFWAFLAALMATAIWVWWIWRQPNADGRTLAIDWCAGLSLCYLFYMTLYLPLAEANMSYRHLAPLRQTVADDVHSPVMSHGLGEPQRAMFEYYCGLKTLRLEVRPGADCDWFLTQTDDRSPQGRELQGGPWKLVWEDVHSQKELFRFYHRETSATVLDHPR
jgi:4-amino-4-deoxy-L-arabinose transferase-like glycosyltransferase